MFSLERAYFMIGESLTTAARSSKQIVVNSAPWTPMPKGPKDRGRPDPIMQ
jgi:hypothetical protein